MALPNEVEASFTKALQLSSVLYARTLGPLLRIRPHPIPMPSLTSVNSMSHTRHQPNNSTDARETWYLAKWGSDEWMNGGRI